MERPKLSDGLIWREKPGGGYYPYIYFKKMHRKHYIRHSSKTDDPKEAERQLRKILDDIDNQELYGHRPKKTFRQGADKLFEEFRENPKSVRPKTLLIYGQQADLLQAFIGDCHLPIWKEDLMPFIEKRRADGVGARTINLALEVVRIINRKACYYWRDEKTRLSWTDHCPILPFESGPKGKPVTLTWEQQEVFFDLLPGIKRKAAMVAVNTGLRDYPLINLRWAWETYSPVLKETVFEIPGEYMKNGKPMTLILNRLARKEIESLRSRHPELVFGEMRGVTNKAWYRAWKEAGLPLDSDRKKGVHNLRHTFGKRLRDAGVDERDVQDLLHHMPKNVTRHYSEPELKKLKECLERIVPSSSLALVAHG